MDNIKPICTGCGKHPEQLEEYIEAAEDYKMDVDEYVKKEEGTYNKVNGHFLCTPCYIDAGMPSLPSPKHWVAP